MAYELKSGYGTIFRNGNGSGNQPVWKGEIRHPKTGEILAIALWEREGRKGPFLSAKVEVPQDQTQKRDHPPSPDDGFRGGAQGRVADRGTSHPFDDIDEVPF